MITRICDTSDHTKRIPINTREARYVLTIDKMWVNCDIIPRIIVSVRDATKHKQSGI